MIELVFTVDYEIFGNGEGSLEKLVLEPCRRLQAIFDAHSERLVVFVEVAELEMIHRHGTDHAVARILQQVRDLRRTGHEIGLHVHPQWYNARYEGGKWQLDYGEYNLCLLPEERIAQIINRAVLYLQELLEEPDFIPRSFRAGNWLVQPTSSLSLALAEKGIRVDSSVFKGGRQRQHGMDFRPAMKNGYYWTFADDVNTATPEGIMWEFPTYSRMVPLWRMASSKRVGLQRKALAKPPSFKQKVYRFLDFVHLFHPLKLDFSRMTIKEWKALLDEEILKDRRSPALFRPIVAIGHTKDLFDLETVDWAFGYLRRHGIRISTLDDVYHRAMAAKDDHGAPPP